MKVRNLGIVGPHPCLGAVDVGEAMRERIQEDFRTMAATRRHTPGPWNVTKGDLIRVLVAWGGQRSVVAGVHRIGSRTGNELGDPVANAHLIAAAPDMLDVLDEVLASMGTDADPALRGRIEATIAKAEGVRAPLAIGGASRVEE